MTRLALRTGYTPDSGMRTLAPTHQRLGIETCVYRLPVLAHMERRRGKPPLYLYDDVNRVFYGDHLYRASITLPKV